MISVVCWLWDDPLFKNRDKFRYTVEHVVRLRRSVERHLTMPHRFLCVTDRPQSAFPDGVEAIPLWDDLARHGSCYRRLKAFSPEMKDILGERFVSVDIDCVVTGDLDPLFSRPEDFVIWQDFSPIQPYCGSMFMMTAGSRSEVWTTFSIEAATDAKEERGYVGSDQAWISSVIPSAAMWTRKDGVYSVRDKTFGAGKIHSFRGMLQRGATRPLPDDARIVFFHGARDPSLADFQKVLPWIEEHFGPPFETV